MIQTILCLSDTHNRHRSLRHLPEADVLVHCGDFTEHGTEEEALDFLNWLCDLPYRHKLFTIGNHDVDVDFVIVFFPANVDALLIVLPFQDGLEILGEARARR